jgi:hypothetical protein
MKELIGKRVLIIWKDDAEAEWIAFRVLDYAPGCFGDQDGWLWLQGVNSPDGSEHDGTKCAASMNEIRDIVEWKEEA